MTVPTTPDPVSRDLARALAPSAGELEALHARLAAAAERDGVLDVAYRTVDTPVGALLLAGTDAGLVRVAYASEDHDAVLQSLADRISHRVLRVPARLDPAARQLEGYFAGQRRTFDLALDWRLSAGFRATVLHHLASDLAYGQTASYGVVARLAGNPGAARAVGTACATNPLPIVVPCHRVVRGDGTMGGYLGGPDAKRTLLDLEAGADRVTLI